MKKYGLELLMACLLLVSFLILSKQAAQVAGTMATTDNSKLFWWMRDMAARTGNDRSGWTGGKRN